MYNKTPLFSCLNRHNSTGRSSFHTPGHKCSSFLPDDIIKLDYTELPDTDALFEANGVIKDCEQLFSRLYGTAGSFISAGGCTLAIQAMIRTACDLGGKLLCARNAHRSAINAMALTGIDPVWIFPRGTNSYTGRIEPDDIRKAFEEHPDITACYITSPSYYGEISDIKQIADLCHENGAVLLVDNAHGSHLAFMHENMHPIASGADMTACSLHKTMPVMTGGALLNIRTKDLAENAKSYMSLFASTSPSYVIMSSMDLCADYMLNGSGKEDYLKCEETVAQLKMLITQKGICQPQGLCDPLRITLNTASVGLYGEDKQQEYFISHGIDCEFCDGENAVLLCTPFNSQKDFERVRTAIEKMPSKIISSVSHPEFELPKKVMTLREAIFAHSEKISVKNSAGRIAADTVCPCPPGVPVIMPGEKINNNSAETLLRYGIEEISVVRDNF